MREENGLAIVLGMAKSSVDRERTGRAGMLLTGASAVGQRAARYLLALDVVIMLGLVGFGLGNLLAGAWRPPKVVPVWVVAVVLVLASLPVVLRRFWPVAAFRARSPRAWRRVCSVASGRSRWTSGWRCTW